MPKQPFTPIGLQDKLIELYALSDAALFLEAKLLSSDLQVFLDNHFIFSAEEKDYITAMDARTTFGIGSRIASTLLIRGVITMKEVPVQSQPRRPKEIIVSGDGTIHWDDDGQILDGDLSIEIDWELLS